MFSKRQARKKNKTAGLTAKTITLSELRGGPRVLEEDPPLILAFRLSWSSWPTRFRRTRADKICTCFSKHCLVFLVSRKHNLSLDFKTQVPQQSAAHGKAIDQEMSISVPRKQGKRYVSKRSSRKSSSRRHLELVAAVSILGLVCHEDDHNHDVETVQARYFNALFLSQQSPILDDEPSVIFSGRRGVGESCVQHISSQARKIIVCVDCSGVFDPEDGIVAVASWCLV